MAAATVLAIVLLSDDTTKSRDRPGTAPSVSDAAELKALKGIDQTGSVLGDTDARARLTVFANIASTEYATFDREVLPLLLRRFVRSSRLAVQVRTQPTPTGGDIAGPARYAQAAGLQTMLWQFVRALAATPQTDGTADRIDAAVASIPGLDPAKLRNDLDSARVRKATGTAADLARAEAPRGAPTFTLTWPGHRARGALTRSPSNFVALARRAVSDADRRR